MRAAVCRVAQLALGLALLCGALRGAAAQAQFPPPDCATVAPFSCPRCVTTPSATATPTVTPTATATPTVTPTATRTPGGVGAYLLIALSGQSNMVGYNTVPGVPDPTSARLVSFGNDWFYHGSAIEPMDCAAPGSGSCTGYQVDAVSNDLAWNVAGYPSFSSAQSMGMYLINNLVGTYELNIIPCAMGATTIAQWMPGADHMARNTLYGSCNARTHRVMNDKPAAVLNMMTYLQGEFDNGNAPGWAASFTSIVASWRQDYGTQLVVCMAQPASSPAIWQAQETLCQPTGSGYVRRCTSTALPRTAIVTTSDLPLGGDNLHFTAYSQRVIGERFAQCYMLMYPL